MSQTSSHLVWVPMATLSDDVYQRLQGGLPDGDKATVRRFTRPADQRRCTVSRHIQRVIIDGITHRGGPSIKRSKQTGNKPIWLPDIDDRSKFFHFNVSHDGEMVVHARSSHLIGVDVMKVEPRNSSGSQDAYFRMMNGQFTEAEWGYIRKDYGETSLRCGRRRKHLSRLLGQVSIQPLIGWSVRGCSEGSLRSIWMGSR
eukprot:GHVO01017548.1.p1 GENE.GHVO01017548.1~~GHVO01017548.1.p1  ORF type:complete len:212 (+),score=30.41 GHVO01017548.1:38-637(+)